MTRDYDCEVRFERGGLTLKGLREAFADPSKLPGCGELPRVNARGLKVAGRGRQIELRFTLTVSGEIAEAADRAARVARTLAQGQRLLAPPILAIAVTRREPGS
jgi:hypothetical protein